MELVCDECVVRSLGEEKKASYARMLIEMEEKKSKLLPFGSYFNQDVVEERIRSIMKIKRTSLLAVCMAVLVIGFVTITFVTSASNDKRAFSTEEYKRLYALQFDGYEKMTVAEYQKRVWQITDTKEYRELLERLDTEEELYEKRDSDEILSYLYYVMEPLSAERWQSREVGGYALTPILYNAVLEFFLTFTIQDAEQVTVGEYERARIEVIDGLQVFLNGKTREELCDATFMEAMIEEEIERLVSLWGSAALQIEVEFSYVPLENTEVNEEIEKRRYAHATEADYRSMFQLMTANYREQSVADFNEKLLRWADEDHERMERISCDVGYDDFAVDLEKDERYFVTVSAELSGMENAQYVKSMFLEMEERDPWYQYTLKEKTAEGKGGGAWCSLYYQFSYHIVDKKQLSVGERDDCVYGMISDVQRFWDETSLDEMLQMTESDVINKLKELAEINSNSEISITISEDDIGFESMDERNIR